MSLRILLVEKDVTTSDLLVPSLERRGYQVTVARSQRQALSRLRTGRPDLLIVDVASFPGSGYKVSEAVRARLESVPTILLVETTQAAAVGGADALMARPYSSRGLLHRVSKLAESLSSRELRAGPLVFDPDTRNLRRGGLTFYLRPKEAALLALFMRNSGRVMTRQEVIKQVWETDYVGDTRTLTVHVRWLRQKIEADPRTPRILRTIRGIGYRFEVPPDATPGP